MKKILLILVCLLNFNISYADNDENFQEKVKTAVQTFIDAVKTDNAQIIADYVEYPYTKHSPLPDILDKEAFIQNYDMVFDKDLKDAIINSELTDWESGGWRGIMLYYGMLWINYEGKLIAINYKTDKEREYIKAWDKKDKDNLHSSLKEYGRNEYVFSTDTRLGRIDEIDLEGYSKSYRLAWWDKNSSMSEKPAIVIPNGVIEHVGTGGNTEYHFPIDGSTYVFFVNYVGPMDMKPYKFGQYKGTDEFDEGSEFIFIEDAHVIK